MKCHEQSMPNAIHGSPHDLTGDALTQLLAKSSTMEKRSFLTRLTTLGPIRFQDTSMECSQCHREHQGAMHTLKSMASDRCQACHTNAFHSFSDDHPEFKDYPYNQPRNISFDHLKHRDMHFSKKGTAFDCKACHVESDQVGLVGQVFRGVSFEKACASCHAEPIKTATQEGLIVLQLPSIDAQGLKRNGLDIGPWPSAASQMNDGTIPPMMRWLIQTEPTGADLLARLPKSGRLSDVDMNDPTARTALAELATVSKSLMQRLANDGQPAFRSAAEQVIQRRNAGPTLVSNTAASTWLDRFAGGVPPDLFRAAVTEWLGQDAASKKIVSQPPKPPSTVRLSSTILSPGDDLLAGTDDLLAPDKKDDLLNANNDSLLPNSNDALGGSQPNTQIELGVFKDSKAWDQLGYGGWMIDRQRVAIVYIPRGHADSWLSQWIEFEEMLGATTMDQQASVQAVKQCRSCHALVAPSESNGIHGQPSWRVSFVNANRTALEKNLAVPRSNNECWKASRRPANLKQITKFDHGPHLTLPTISDCRSCHMLPDAQASDSQQGNSGPEFISMERSQCTSCHQKDAAGESCTQCHNYHVN
jgi:hypothetical protein